MKKKIIIVDDNPDILEVTKIIIEKEGYEAKTSQSGEPLYHLGEELPDLIILDVMLNGEDGRDICNYLKGNEKTKHIPIILYSAHSKQELNKASKLCTPDCFMAKPFSISDLKENIERLISTATSSLKKSNSSMYA